MMSSLTAALLRVQTILDSMPDNVDLASSLYPLYKRRPELWESSLRECKRRRGIEEDNVKASRSPATKQPLSTKNKKVIPFSREMVSELNRLRTRPKSFIRDVEKHLARFTDRNPLVYVADDGSLVRSKEGRDVVLETISYLQSVAAAPPLSCDVFLEKAAMDHVADSCKHNITGHVGSDKSTLSDRISRYCRWNETIGENIDYCFTDDPTCIVLDLLIDGM